MCFYSFRSLNFVLSDQVADIEFYQTNQAMALTILKTYLRGMHTAHALSLSCLVSNYYELFSDLICGLTKMLRCVIKINHVYQELGTVSL